MVVDFSRLKLQNAIYIKYYDGSKKMGHKNPEFMDQFNNVFICLVTTALYHHLIIWKSGIPDDNGPEFKTEARWCKHNPFGTFKASLISC